MIQDQADITKMVMESKNNMVDAILKMMSAAFASSQKPMIKTTAKLPPE